MKNLFLLLPLVVIAILPLQTLAQFDVVHDIPNTTTSPIIKPLILADGSVVTHQYAADMHRLRMYDQDGALLWTKEYPGENYINTMIRDNTSGFSVNQWTWLRTAMSI